MKNTNNKEQVADSNGAQMENNYKISNHTLMYSKIKTITVQL